MGRPGLCSASLILNDACWDTWTWGFLLSTAPGVGDYQLLPRTVGRGNTKAKCWMNWHSRPVPKTKRKSTDRLANHPWETGDSSLWTRRPSLKPIGSSTRVTAINSDFYRHLAQIRLLVMLFSVLFLQRYTHTPLAVLSSNDKMLLLSCKTSGAICPHPHPTVCHLQYQTYPWRQKRPFSSWVV